MRRIQVSGGCRTQNVLFRTVCENIATLSNGVASGGSCATDWRSARRSGSSSISSSQDHSCCGIRAHEHEQSRAKEQALASAQAAHDRLSVRLDAMCLDKLDGRITTAYYDEKAATWRAEQTALLAKINDPRNTTRGYEDAITAIEQTSTLCNTFPNQPPTEQRRLLKIIIATATWQHGKLETTLQPPFEELRLSNRANHTKHGKNENGRGKMKDWLPGRTRT